MATIMNQKRGIWATLLLSASFFYRPIALPDQNHSSQVPLALLNQASPSKITTSEEGPWTPFCEHSAVEPTSRVVGGDTQPAASLSNHPQDLKSALKKSPVDKTTLTESTSYQGQAWHRCKPDAFTKFVIATVPDPEETHLALDFDRYVESIAWAVADSNFSLENYWFPWQTMPNKEETDADKRQAAKQNRQQRLEMPGTILFRRNRPEGRKEELLAVFLVGENPTFGVNRVAFRTALLAIEAMSPKNCCFYMIGPSFSGSLPRLSRLLSDPNLWRGLLQKPFIIVSGQATSTVELDWFRLEKVGTLCTTVHDDRYAIHYFLSYLQSKENRKGPDIALLSEDETVYGQDLQREGSKQENGEGVKQDNIDGRVLMVRYPRGIARLRNTNNELPNVGIALSGTSHETLPDLPLILKETGEDIIRTFSQQQTPVSSEAVLIDIAGMVRRNQIRYIVLLATDPLDTLFLVRFLHVACPNVQLVIFSSDLLFARVAHSWSIEGLLAVTTYPLFIENQDYMEPQKPPRRIPFSSGYAEGVYNATRRVLIDLEPEMPSCKSSCNVSPGLPTQLSKMLEYSSPYPDLKTGNGISPKGVDFQQSFEQRPPLWLTILGHDGFWPVALLDGKPDPNVKSTILQDTRPTNYRHVNLPEKPSVLWLALFGVVGLYSIAVLLAIAVMNLRPGNKLESWSRASSFIRNFAVRTPDHNQAGRAVNVCIILITVALVNAILLITFYGLDDWWISKGFCAIMLLIATTESLWMTIISIRCKPRWDVIVLMSFSWLFGISCASALSCTLHSVQAVHTLNFFGYRAFHPESGVCPILPALILAIGYHYWAWIQLRRLRWIEERQPSTLEYPCVCFGLSRSNVHTVGSYPVKKPWFVEAPRLLQDEIESIFGLRTAIASLPLIALWLLFFWPPSHVNSMEPVSYQVFFGILLTVMYGMLIGNWVRFLFLWKDFSQMLHFLESHPLRDAFSRLPSDFSWTSIWFGSLQPQLITLTRSHDCLRTLVSRGVYLLPANQLDEVSRNLETIGDEQRSGKNRYGPIYHAAFNTIERLYACAAHEAAIRLEDDWRKGHADSISEYERKIAPAALSAEQQTRWAQEEFLTLRYVAYIRYVLQQMRNFLEFVTTAFILLAIATVAYPFQGHHSIATAHLILFLVLSVGIVLVFLRMDRDPLLSRLNGSKPNEVGLAFLWRVLSYGSIPLLTLLGSQFPSIREFLFSWVQPAMQAIK